MSEQNFLGVGWDLAVALDDDNHIEMAHYEESIRQSIWIILSTSPGERIMRPTFGSNLQALVFEMNGSSLASSAASAVRNALTRWEPRTKLLDVSAFPDPDKPNLLHINISYQVRATNSRKNLVYPFYLEHI
ncbi:MAG: GPW/gp25 family protein [Aestuariibacter sp.]|nr:GPW/gp25 family protein [Aestuariibacter sp.]